MATEFDASRYLTKLQGRDYLEVRWRLLWLRTEHPDAEVETHPVMIQDDVAVFRARVSIPGGGAATGHASCSRQEFRDYVEKAETAALGRALGALGYGTQFAAEFEEGKPADAPVQRQAPRRAPVVKDELPPNFWRGLEARGLKAVDVERYTGVTPLRWTALAGWLAEHRISLTSLLDKVAKAADGATADDAGDQEEAEG